jgi:hypothetical protein
MVLRDSSGEVLSNPSSFLTSPSLFDGLDFRILDNFAIAGSVSTSLTAIHYDDANSLNILHSWLSLHDACGHIFDVKRIMAQVLLLILRWVDFNCELLSASIFLPGATGSHLV